jgi:hypothetical protein
MMIASGEGAVKDWYASEDIRVSSGWIPDLAAERR